MIYPVNGLKLKLAAWNEELMNDLDSVTKPAPGWLDPQVCWFELLEGRLGRYHPETKKAFEMAYMPRIFCLIILPLLTGLMA